MSDQRPTNQNPEGGGSPVDTARASARHLEEHTDLGRVMARASQENFPVALRMLPNRLADHLRAIYGYARLVDNLGDEYPGDRSAALDWMEAQLDSLFVGTATHPVFKQLTPTVQRFELPRTPFDNLLAANRMDQSKTRYADWRELMEYCTLSANPVGHLVLAIFESTTTARVAASDSVCSGLQVLEHLQDVGEDSRAGRIYLPTKDLERFGCPIEDLNAATASPNLRKVVEHLVARTRILLTEGRWLTASLRGHARVAISGYVAGGLAGLDAIEAAQYDVLGGQTKAGSAGLLRRYVPLYLGSLLRRGGDR